MSTHSDILPAQECPILHVDMDAFYASVSLISRPELRGQPVVIGGGWRSVVLCATYEARAYGVASGMPMARAQRLCPQAVVLPPDFDHYAWVSEAVMAVLAEVSPVMEPISMEEAFLDVRGARRRLGSSAQVAGWIRDTIANEQGIACSVGGATSKAVAKMASKAAKPAGQRLVTAEETLAFLHPLPVGALWGVGEKLGSTLQRLGLKTVADVAHTPLGTLQRVCGYATAERVHQLTWGQAPDPVTPARIERSVGSSQTFASDIDDPVLLRQQLLTLSDRTTRRLRRAGFVGRTVTLTVRFSDFTTLTRSKTSAQSTDVSREVYGVALSLFNGLGLQRARVRLLGVRVEGLEDADQAFVQGRLGEREFGWREAERAVDRAITRFGGDAIRPASILGAD